MIRKVGVVAAVVAVALFLRIVWPLADPAARFSWSNGVYTDPATMVHAARNVTVFGEWIVDYNRDLFYYPLMNGLTWILFQIVGPGRLATVILSALAGAGTLVALVWALRKCAGNRAALWGAVLGGINSWMVMYSRIPLAENVVLVLLTLSSAFVIGRSSRSQALAGALAVGATLFGKYHAAGFLPGLVLFVALRDRSFRALLPLLGGGTVVFLAWLTAVFLPHRSEVLGHVTRQTTELHGSFPIVTSLREGLGEIYNTVRRSWLFYRIPVCGAVGGFFAIWTLLNPAARRRALEDGSAIFAFWFVGLWIYFSALPYKAPRYFVLVVPPLVAGTAILLDRLSRARDFRLRAPSGWGEHLPWILWIYSTAFTAIDSAKQYASMSLDHLTLPPPRISDGTYNFFFDLFTRFDTYYQTLAWALVLAVVAYGVLLLGPRLVRVLPGSRLQRLAPLALALAVGVGGSQFVWWTTHRTTYLEDIKSSLPKIVGPDAVLLGPMAPLLTQDTRLRVHPYFGPPGEEGLLAEYGVTHVVVSGRGEARVLEERFPGLLEESALVHSWPVQTLFSSSIEVRRLPRDFAGRALHAYAPTAFEEATVAVAAGRWSEALEHFSRHPGAPEETPEILSLESVCWFNLGDYDRSEKLLEEAIRLRPDDSLNYQNLAAAVLARGDRARAIELLFRALRLDPGNAQLESDIREVTR